MNANIIRCARAILHVTDLEASRHFYVDVLGFIETEADDRHIYLRGLEEHTHHSLVLKKADEPCVEVLGYKVFSSDDLKALSVMFEQKGFATKWLKKGEQHAIGDAFRVQDVNGMPLEFFAEIEPAERMLQRYDMYKGARMQRIDHFNCMVSNVEQGYDFYQNKLGFACSEYTETENGNIWAAWLHRKQTVHDLALMNGKGPRLHHIGFSLPDPLAIIHACDVLAASGYGDKIERGPGRHGLSNAFFLYLRDPDGHRIELYNGDYLTSDPDFKPIRWAINDPMRQTFWGHEAPDCWFNEASSVLDILTEEKMDQEAAKLKQHKPTFVI
ncbi:3,4-dihydroxyphenylacetate 2,3-dioxygenase [Virgibacillus siamensis]|uniref:3,4-dihydroxyphenylacetate 2,3-dioxygenase n=1 Tax=Virgibacillus siamensis TaxID=480071 RepID=A0ABN1FGF5_9BACI